jgi:hypothetical protein
MENKDTHTPRKRITSTFVSGTTSCTLIIAKELAKRYGIDEPSHVIVEGTEEGILIRKLELDNKDGIKLGLDICRCGYHNVQSPIEVRD